MAPAPDEPVFRKRAASAFYAEGLVSHLILKRIDTLVVAGCTTSGCVRATVVDSASHGYRTIVPHECVFDRALIPHRLNLCDMHAKYALVCSLADTLRWLGQRAHSRA